MSMNVPSVFLIVVIGLLGVGLYALLTVRNLIKVVVALQILVKGAMLAFVLVGRLTGQVNLGQSLALTVIVADTIVAVVGLTLAVQVRRKFGSLDIKDLTTLKR
ncbi:MAG TPA: NADH-quinone oxidoreductase subunit K [Anaerolineaceae bacterium]|jgi:NADH:ubiquinone oxidoreductase subunit K|nr:NADH-quinone oxidoreductase subunit K [Anaerolineaceae bacterium]NMD32016.1 NADH-quinone oxidoreductase subunit K [Chloroflexota bacterium]HNS63287.1 NADH-quinone oxidoreductase subunit K [Anaerolineaceae bacterium]HNY99750.1 NADH-quinone oxidoreductase subunit K [Anaerolineaceae bacterium]HOH19000.1 NADH-quinone oxidoreductase subunit K [Anaerolineaceae bacterium]